VNTFVNGLFQGEIAGLDVKPLTLMSVQELEDLLPIMASGKATWNEILDSRFTNGRVSPFSVHQAGYDLAKAKGLPYLRNQLGAATLERRPSAQEFNKLGPIDCLSAVA
jgi:hypothetical protein